MAGEEFGKLVLGAYANSGELDRSLLSLIPSGLNCVLAGGGLSSNEGIASLEDSTTSWSSSNEKWEDVEEALSTKTYAQRGLHIACDIDPAGDYGPLTVAAVAADEVAIPSPPQSLIPTPAVAADEVAIPSPPQSPIPTPAVAADEVAIPSSPQSPIPTPAVAADEVAIPSSPQSPTPEDLLKQGSIIIAHRILNAVKDIQVGNEVLVANTWNVPFKFGQTEPFQFSNLAPSEVKEQYKVEFRRLDAARGHQPSSVDVGRVASSSTSM